MAARGAGGSPAGTVGPSICSTAVGSRRVSAAGSVAVSGAGGALASAAGVGCSSGSRVAVSSPCSSAAASSCARSRSAAGSCLGLVGSSPVSESLSCSVVEPPALLLEVPLADASLSASVSEQLSRARAALAAPPGPLPRKAAAAAAFSALGVARARAFSTEAAWRSLRLACALMRPGRHWTLFCTRLSGEWPGSGALGSAAAAALCGGGAWASRAAARSVYIAAG